MAFDSFKMRWRSLWSTRKPAPPPPRGPSTALQPFGASPPSEPSPLTAADMKCVRDYWDVYCRHHTGLTPEQFLDILERRRRTFAEERRAREARLAQLNASIRPLP